MKHTFLSKERGEWIIVCPITGGSFSTSLYNKGYQNKICPCCREDITKEISPSELKALKGGFNNKMENEEQTQMKDHTFSEEYPKEDLFEGEYQKVEDILEKLLRIINFVQCSGKKGKFIGINAELTEEENKKINFSISGIVENQIKKASEDNKLPLLAKIIQKESKEHNYYTLA